MFNRIALLALVVLSGLAVGCSSEDASTTVTASLALEVPAAIQDADPAGFRIKGIYDLEVFEAYAAIEMKAAGAAVQIVAWPEDQEQTAAAAADVVDFELEVEPGVELTVEAVAFIYSEGGTIAYVPDEPASVTPVENEATQLDLVLSPSAMGTIRGVLEGDEVAVWVVDLTHMVKLGEASLTGDKFEFLQAPVDRDLILAVESGDGTITAYPDNVIRLALAGAVFEFQQFPEP
jgi:hypothetical protein